MKTYRAGIVGLTGIGAGRSHPDPESPLRSLMPPSHTAAYAALPETRIAAVCDLNPEMLSSFREVWSDACPDTACYTDHRRMLAEERLDLLSVVTSDHVHAGIVVDACAAGVKAIFCEKPIATSLEDADRMIAACEAAGTVMSINHTRRWYPLYNQVRARIRAGDIGRLTRVVGTLGGPRAMLFRNGTHLIDTVLMLVESEPEWVFAELDEGFEDYFNYRGDGGRDPAGDPGGSCYIHFRNGARAFLNASKGTPGGFSLELFGEEGRITVSDGEGALLHAGGACRRIPVPEHRLAGTAAGIEELIRRLEGRSPGVASPPEQARVVLQILLGFLRSQEIGNGRVPIESGPRKQRLP